MRKTNWQILYGMGLLLASTLLYLIHYLIYKDVQYITYYLLGNIAFLPVEVLIVTFIIQKWLTAREKKEMLNKLNMAIGTFYSEAGTELLHILSGFVSNADGLTNLLEKVDQFSHREFEMAEKKVKSYELKVNAADGNFEGLQDFLSAKRGFLLTLLQNPNLLEHETFTELLWSVFHLMDELSHRKDLQALPIADIEHLSGDINRAYTLLVSEWLKYISHLREEYPYLFSLAVRTNPFNCNSSVEIR